MKLYDSGFDRLLVSAFEAVPGAAPLNNARWALYERRPAGQKLCRNRDRWCPQDGRNPAAAGNPAASCPDSEADRTPACIARRVQIDNFSRRILSWKVAPTFDPTATARILLTASKGMGNDKPVLLTDGGVENVKGAVDALVASGLLSRISTMWGVRWRECQAAGWAMTQMGSPK
jgi:hypothetical protein